MQYDPTENKEARGPETNFGIPQASASQALTNFSFSFTTGPCILSLWVRNNKASLLSTTDITTIVGDSANPKYTARVCYDQRIKKKIVGHRGNGERESQGSLTSSQPFIIQKSLAVAYESRNTSGAELPHIAMHTQGGQKKQ